MLNFGIGAGVLVVVVMAIIFIAMMFRKVVSTNTVHIVQSRRNTIPYGTKQEAGNVYYAWPASIPFFGVTVIELPVSNFDLSLKDYEAYDKDRVPFMVDVTAFFRIKDTALAAQRVVSIGELENQLSLIVQGAVRKVLASDNIDSIMLERSKFGDDFTQEVADQLKEWGVESVKSMELMDIRDAHDSRVIANIMAKKTSHIEMESRKEVAENHKQAETAEIEAKQTVDIRAQEAEEQVGKRRAEKEKLVGIAGQQSEQEVLKEKKVTREHDMEVMRVEEVKKAEIEKDKQVVAATQKKETQVIIADGELEAKKKEANGIKAIGEAKADAEKAMQMAPVSAQITLAKEIGNNAGYQQYLMTIEAVKAHIIVGSKQAEALQGSDVKVIANAGQPVEGVKSFMNLFSTNGGTQLAGMVEAFAQSPIGKDFLDRLGVDKQESVFAEAGSKKEDGE